MSPLLLSQTVPCTGTGKPGAALRVPSRAHGLGECRTSLPWGPKSGQASAGHGPPDNCSSQPFLISGEISRVPAQRDTHRDKVLRKQLTMPLHWQGSGERGCWGHSGLAFPPLSLSPVLHLPCSALSAVPDTETLPSPPSLAAVGCAVGPWGPWSGCSSPCGVGSRARSRQVTVPPRHGGDPCPDLKQRRGCLGQHPTCGTAKGNAGCLLPSCLIVPVCCRPGVSLTIPLPLTAALLPEVAKILPNSFSQDFRDPWRRAGLPLPEEPSGYVWSWGPSLTPLPKAGTPPTPPCAHGPFAPPDPGSFCSPQPLLFSVAPLHPHT